MLQTLRASLVAFLFLFLWLLEKRLSVDRAQQEIEHLHKELELLEAS